jgi:2'-5' RNA ligase
MNTATMTTVHTTAGLDLTEYLLVVSPDEKITAAIQEEKQVFARDYAHPGAARTKPHITVACFMAQEGMEDTLVRWMHRIISARKRFTVALNGYGGFRPHTLYLRVQEHGPFQQLARELQTVDHFVRSNGCPPMRLVTCPHLSIARGLPEPVYRQMAPVYGQKKFQAAFDVKELLLLRRKHAFDTCQRVSLFGLQP